MDSVQRRSPAVGKEGGDGLVGEDHQLLDEHVRVRLGLEVGALHAAVVVEDERDLFRLDAQRTAVEAPAAQLGREPLGEPEIVDQLVLLAFGEYPLHLPVAEALVAVDHRAVELRLARLQMLVEEDFDRDRQTVFVGPQRAGLVGELVREHRRDEPRHVHRVRPLGGAAVERRSGRHEVRDVGDVHPRAQPVALGSHRQGVIEVLRGLRVDRERHQVAKVDPPVVRRLRNVERLESTAHPFLDEQGLEHALRPSSRSR